MGSRNWEELTMPERVEIIRPAAERYVEVLSPRALELLVRLHDRVAERRLEAMRNEVILDDGPPVTLVTKDVVERMIDEELRKIQELNGDGFDTARYGQAVGLFTEVALADSFTEFLTLPAHERMP
jgi:Ribonuclease G/E